MKEVFLALVIIAAGFFIIPFSMFAGFQLASALFGVDGCL